MYLKDLFKNPLQILGVKKILLLFVALLKKISFFYDIFQELFKPTTHKWRDTQKKGQTDGWMDGKTDSLK